MEQKYTELEHVRDSPKYRRPTVHENIHQYKILSAVENRITRELSNGLTNQTFSKKLKYYSYKEHLVKGMAEDDFDRRNEFCKYTMDQTNRNYIVRVLFSNEAAFH